MQIFDIHDRNNESYYRFVKSIENDFYPPLSQRDGGIQAFIEKVYVMNGNVSIIKDKGVIVGSLSYWITEENDAYIWLIVIDSKLRGTPKGTMAIIELLRYNTQKLQEEHGHYLRYVEFRTWEGNSPAQFLYKRLGFEYYKKVQGDVIKGRTTVFYRDEFKNCYERFVINS